MRTITLELLRRGPAHNQLLSPLTTYLALCENLPAVTVSVPFEHNQFLHRLGALTYKSLTPEGEEARVFQLQDMARAVGSTLKQVDGLATALKPGPGEEPMAHLRLIISASELALLPFELTLSPDNFPGPGQPLLLQPQTPVTLTRETRRASAENFRWPTKARVLFIAAQPAEVGPIPLESHLLALRRVVDPWVGASADGDGEARRRQVSEHLVLLTGADINAIQRECASGGYTHVHILAHGKKVTEGFDQRFHLALHDAHDPEKADLISGPRLAAALRVTQRQKGRGLSCPAVVTLASCDSGNVGSVAGAGSSIAHALHEAGIPVVVGGQFPLSFEGSVRLVEGLYEGLLWGEDPRQLLHDLRRRLYAQFPHTHDWASLTAYVSLPPAFDERLPRVRLERLQSAVKVCWGYADQAAQRFFEEGGDGLPADARPEGAAEDARRLEEVLERTRDLKARLETLLEDMPAEGSEISGLIASTEKRQGELLYALARGPQVAPAARERLLAESLARLESARDYYWKAFSHDRLNSWGLVQYLSPAVLTWRRTAAPGASAGEDLSRLWWLAYLHSDHDLRDPDSGIQPPGTSADEAQRRQRERVIWAHGNLLELYLLSLVMGRHAERPTGKKAAALANEHADSLIKLAGRGSFEITSTYRQVFRYVRWYAPLFNLDGLLPAAEEILGKLKDNLA